MYSKYYTLESNWFESEIESQACESELNQIVKYV